MDEHDQFDFSPGDVSSSKRSFSRKNHRHQHQQHRQKEQHHRHEFQSQNYNSTDNSVNNNVSSSSWSKEYADNNNSYNNEIGAVSSHEFSGHNSRQFYQEHRHSSAHQQHSPARSDGVLSHNNESNADSAAAAAAVVAQEMTNVQTLKRLSIGAMSALDPDLPQFNSSGYRVDEQAMPSHHNPQHNHQQQNHQNQQGVSQQHHTQSSSFQAPTSPTSPSKSAEISASQASQLLWVPANVHPELAPQEWKSFVQKKVAEIRETVSSHPQPSSLSNETTNEFPSRETSLKRRNSRLSKQINTQEGYTDGSEVLKRRSSTSSDGAQSISSLSAQLKTLGELESLAMDPFQLARSLSQSHYQNYPSTSGNNQFVSSERERSASISLPAIREPLQNDSDEPILPAPSASLRRATRTRYGRPSLKKSRGAVALSKIDTSIGDKSQASSALEKKAGHDHNQESAPDTIEELPIKESFDQDSTPFKAEQKSEPENQPIQHNTPELPSLSPIRPLVVNKNKASSHISEHRSLKHDSQNSHFNDQINDNEPSKSIPNENTPDIEHAEYYDNISQPLKSISISDINHQSGKKMADPLQSNTISSSQDDLSIKKVDDESVLTSKSFSTNSEIGNPSFSQHPALTSRSESLPISSSIDGLGGSLTKSKSEDDNTSLNSATSTSKSKARKSSWRRLFNSASDTNEKENLSVSSSTSVSSVDKQSVDRLLNRGASDVSDMTSSTASSDKKGLSAFFSKKKSKKDSLSNELQTSHGIGTVQKPNSASRGRSHSPDKRGRLHQYKSSTSPTKSARYRVKYQASEMDERLQKKGSKGQQLLQQQRHQDVTDQQENTIAGYSNHSQQDYGGGLPYNIPPHQMSDKALIIMTYNRYPLHIERAIYRLSHLKLANPRRPLAQQVLLSNFMYAYLNLINHGYQQQQQLIQQQQIMAQQSIPGSQFPYNQIQYQEYNNGESLGQSEGYDYDYQQEQYEGYDQYEHDQDVSVGMVNNSSNNDHDNSVQNPKKSPSTESTSSSSSSSSGPTEDMWNGDEAVDLADLESNEDVSKLLRIKSWSDLLAREPKN